ncbi:SAM-dependent methyltransferase [Streptomyces sp. NBC_01275]|uniref:SAM-dependent methyltransferase n=1 Tax=Streptomyces sp. NBC_01275 TaxID=2903807 RepID=UPI00224EBF93|nr:SAM-dependent methyltransferase [Streptomyces sp. NBC_01275]MCX4766467.1 SAM-dependent methyltransferase [Streptomyces sp. NBC_01275]
MAAGRSPDGRVREGARDVGGTRLDTSVAHNARVWNYWIGGKDNYEVDQRVGEHVAGMFPLIRDIARADRWFLGRATRFLAEERGMRQFLDIGTGLPTADNTHEIAQRIAPESRIVYVDNDPIVLAHARTLLTGTDEGRTDYIDADVHDPAAILERAAGTLDFTRPVAVMMLGILNFVLDVEAARDIVRRIMAEVPSGSCLVLTHPTHDGEVGGEGQIPAMKFWNENATPPITARSGADIAAFFDGLDLLEPGLVSCSRWRAGADSPAVVPQYGAVAVKP